MKPTTLQCKICGKMKPPCDFHKCRHNKSGRYSYCKKCVKSQKRVTPQYTLSTQNSNLKIKYGITIQDFNQMFDKQKGCCAICGKHQSELNRTLDVDHDHKINKVRGLLCSNCNRLLGYAKENRGILFKAIQYLDLGPK